MQLQTIRYYWSYIILTIVWDNHLFHNSKYLIYISRLSNLDSSRSIYYNYSIDFWNILIQLCIDGYSAISFKIIQFIGIKVK